jgi:acyl-CoA thioesterase I
MDTASYLINRNKNSYPAQLQQLLGSKYQVLNYGLSGRTLLKSGDFPYWNSDFFKITREVDPDIVLIMLGTNDTKPKNWNSENYERDLVEFVNIYKNLPSHPTVYLMAPRQPLRTILALTMTLSRNR